MSSWIGGIVLGGLVAGVAVFFVGQGQRKEDVASCQQEVNACSERVRLIQRKLLDCASRLEIYQGP